MARQAVPECGRHMEFSVLRGTDRVRFFTLLLAAVVLAGCSGGQDSPRFSRRSETVTPETPAVARLRAGAADANLVIILIDAARADHFSSFGYERKTTPRIDKLFDESILFTDAYSPAADTKATVSSLFTSQHPDTHGVIGRSTGLDPESGATLAESMKEAGCTTVGFSANPYLCAGYGFARGFDSLEEVFREVDIMPMGVGRVDGRLLLDATVGWLRAHRDERFFAYLHFLEPHAPYAPPNEWRERMGAHGTPLGTDIMLDYDANLAYVDHLVGELLVEMDRLGLLDTSVVVFLSDHGEAFGEHGEHRHGRTVYQEMTHVPIAFRLPAGCGASPRARQEVFAVTDIMPTVLDLFQIAPPDTMQGRSRLRLLAGEEEAEPAFVVSRARGDDYTGGVEHPEKISYGLRGPEYLLILGAEGQQVELYHRPTDPTEHSNIAEREPQVVKKLRREFEAWGETQRVRPAVLRGGGVFASDVKRVVVDEETRRRLRAIGYVH